MSVLLKKFLSTKRSCFNRLLSDLYNNDNTSFNETERMENLEFYIYYFNENVKDDVKFLTIKRNELRDELTCEIIKYSIVKELYTDTLFFTCEDLIVLYIKEQEFEEFYLSFMLSNIYKFEIYKSPSHYIAFCTSHKSNEIKDLKQLLFCNNSCVKSIFLSYLLNQNESVSKVPSEFMNRECISKVPRSEELGGESETEYESESENESLFTGIVILNRDYKMLVDKIKYTFEYDSSLGFGEKNNLLVSVVDIIIANMKINTYYPMHYLNF